MPSSLQKPLSQFSRRELLSGCLSGLLMIQSGRGAAQTAQRSEDRSLPQFFIAPSASGTGMSWADAASIETLPDLITRGGPGSIIHIRADENDFYDLSGKTLRIERGGTKQAPVTIRGIRSDGSIGYAHLHSDRTPWTLPASPEAVTDISQWNPGGDLFLVASGAQHIVFEHLDLRRAGNAIRLSDHMRGFTIRNCRGYNVRRFLEMSSNIDVSDVVVSHVTVIGFSKHCFRCRGTGGNWLFEAISANSGRQDGDNFAVGIGINEKAHDIVIRNSEFSNCHDSQNRYWNSDGISSEEENSDILIEHVVCHGHTDGGLDLKSSRTMVKDCEFYDNKINVRAWGDIALINTVTRSAHLRGGVGYAAHIGVYANKEVTANLRIDGIRMLEKDPSVSLFSLGGENTTISLARYEIDKAPGTAFIRKDRASGATMIANPPLL
jgi:hypothetical protein